MTGYANGIPTDPSLFSASGLEKHLSTVWGDVRDQQFLSNSLSAAGAEIVFHLAAQSLVRASYSDPLGTYSTNVMGTANLLESVRISATIRAVVIVTSDKCYENREWVWGYRENDPMGGHDPYSSSKGCAELVTAAFRSSFFSDHAPSVASVRAGNVIGGGDWSTGRLVPDMIRAFSENKPVVLRSPTAVRPWQHVLEPLNGYLTLAQRLYDEGKPFAEAWNFAPEMSDTCTVFEVAQRLQCIYGIKDRVQIGNSDGPHEAALLRLDSSKARNKLAWRPRLDLNSALEWIFEWHQAHVTRQNMQQITLEQLKRYEDLRPLGAATAFL